MVCMHVSVQCVVSEQYVSRLDSVQYVSRLDTD
jgi:hypothetical protein